MSGTSKFITAQVGAKLVTITLGSANSHGARKFGADMFGAVGTLRKCQVGYYTISVELREIGQSFHRTGSTISECTDRFFNELRYQNRIIEAAQIDTAQPPAGLFCDGADSPTRDDFELNNHEHDKANW